MRRIWIIVILELLLFALQDVMLWARIFEADQLWQYIGIYHQGWMVMLMAMALLPMFWLWPRWQQGLLHAAMLLSLAFGGLEDVLYYVLQAKPIPEGLPWLDAHPLILFSPVTYHNLIGSVVLWLLAWGLASWAISARARILIGLTSYLMGLRAWAESLLREPY